MVGKNDYFKSICNVTRAFATKIGKEELLELIVQSAIDTMNAKAACLFLMDAEKDVSVPVAQQGLSGDYLHAGRKSAREAVVDVTERGYLAIRDAIADPRSENHAIKMAEGIASILSVPVKVQDRVIGVLTVYTAEPRDFSEDEVDFLTALAESGGMIIELGRLITQLKHNTRIFQGLSASINSTLDLKEIMQILSADVARGLNVKGASVRFFNEDKSSLILLASYGLSENFLKTGPISVEKSVAMAHAEKPVVVENAATDDRIQYKEEIREEGIVSMLCVPIRTKKEVLGLLRLYSGVVHEFSKDEIHLVSALAHQGGLAIEQARLFKQINDNTVLFHDLSASINSSLDIKKIMHILSADVSEALKTKGASIRLFDNEKRTLNLVASYGLSEKFLNKGPVLVKNNIAHATKGKPVVVKDVSSDRRVQYRDEVMEEGIASILSVPIKAKEEVIGVLNLFTDMPREFDEYEVMLVSALAHQGGVAIQNASMYLMLQEDMKVLKEDMFSHRSWF